MKRTVVLNVVGLTRSVLQRMPKLLEWSNLGASATIDSMGIPAVTCAMQACYLTGKYPSDHGIVGNGWYFKDECEVKFWRQSPAAISGVRLRSSAPR